jgi:8-oxo-dGTP pyrophosphatase MutT (NUDIX family)
MISDTYDDDEAFLFATRIEHTADEGRWTIYVDPDEHLVGPATDLSVDTLRESGHDCVKTDGQRSYRGRLLFSAGVVLLVNGQPVLLQRGPGAPSDPGKWQSPAGRCEHPPGETALKEFYEELVVLEDDRPVFVTYDGQSGEFKSTYELTLQHIGRHTSPEKWSRYRGTIPDVAVDQVSTVELTFGEQLYTDEMVAFFDENNSTLELRYVIEIETPTPERMEFLDGEFDRTVRRFDPAKVCEMDPDDLVPTDAYLADKLYPKLV